MIFENVLDASNLILRLGLCELYGFAGAVEHWSIRR